MALGINGLGLGLLPSMPAAAAFAPTDVENLMLWADASDASTITHTTGAVDEWRDKSGNENHLAASGTARPTTGSATINGKNALAFDGSNDRMDTDGNPFGASVVDALVMILYKINTISNSNLFSLTGDGAAANRWQAHCPFGDGNIYFDTDTQTGAGRVSGASGFSAGEVHLVEFYGSDTEEVQELWVDGSELDSDETGHTVPATSNGIQIGSVTGLTACHCDILHFLVFNGTVSDEDRASLRAFLLSEGGIG